MNHNIFNSAGIIVFINYTLLLPSLDGRGYRGRFDTLYMIFLYFNNA